MWKKIEVSKEIALFCLPALEDNYIYAICSGKKAFVIDPGVAEVVSSLLEKENLILETILITHHHSDHTAGVIALKEKTGCFVIGPKDSRILGLDQEIIEEDLLNIEPFKVQVLLTPGHTIPHLVYFFQDFHWLFSGDLIFGGGCGYLFEGTSLEMWGSMKKILKLPDVTQIFCGHEYTVKNLEFAQKIEPDNQAIKERLVREKKRECTIPFTLLEEKRTNPFLRVEEKALKRATCADSPEEVFKVLREKKQTIIK